MRMDTNGITLSHKNAAGIEQEITKELGRVSKCKRALLKPGCGMKVMLY